MAEWSKAAVLKTVVPQGTVGSNPTSSAIFLRGCRQAVRHQLPKLIYAGSIPVTRSILNLSSCFHISVQPSYEKNAKYYLSREIFVEKWCFCVKYYLIRDFS